MKNASGSDAWTDERSPEAGTANGRPQGQGDEVASRIPPHPEGPIPGEYERKAEPRNDGPMPTGGVPSDPASGTGPEADPADAELRREAGGAPSERRRRPSTWLTR
jgi:hypothetical protein